MEELRKMRADECFAPDAWVTTWDTHNPGVLALVRKHGEGDAGGAVQLYRDTRQGPLLTLWAAATVPQTVSPSGWRM